MKKVRNIITIVCTLAVAVFMWMQAGAPFLKLLGGPTPLGPEDDLAQVEGEYISCEVAYPVATYVEEYYSGDPDRVKDYGYVVYDAERQAFFCIVEDEQKDGDYASLKYNLELAAELRATKDMTPAPIWGSVETMDQAAIDEAIEALEECDIVTMYRDYRDEKTYFGDEYGEVMADMCQQVLQGIGQTEWYYIESAKVNGIETGYIWICILTAAVSILIALGSLISLFTGGKAKDSTKVPDSVNAMERFLGEQRGWVEEWCQYCLNKAVRSAYLGVVIWVVILVAIGILVKNPVQRILVFYLPLGILLGELTALLLMWIQKGQSKPKKILKRMRKAVQKVFPAPGAQEEFAEDFLKAGEEWAFQERKKDSMLYGRLGSRYWTAFQGHGAVTVVDVSKLERVEPETVSGSVRSGKVRVSYESYVANFYYQGTALYDNADKAFSFQTVSGRNAFIALALKKGVEGVKIREA